MANNFKHTRIIQDTVKVKGVVNIDDDGAYIEYEKDHEEYTVNVKDLLAMFSGETISFIVSSKDEIDLDE